MGLIESIPTGLPLLCAPRHAVSSTQHLDGCPSVMHDEYNMSDASPDPTSDTPPKKRRFRLRYSLRSLLLFVLLVNSACLLWMRWEPWQVEHVLRGHKVPVLSAAFSPDGRRIVTASGDATARVWDSETGRELKVLRGHKKAISGIAFSPDGRRIVTAGLGGTARVWDSKTGHELLVLKGHKNMVMSAGFSPDGGGNGEVLSRLLHEQHYAHTRAIFSPDVV